MPIKNLVHLSMLAGPLRWQVYWTSCYSVNSQFDDFADTYVLLKSDLDVQQTQGDVGFLFPTVHLLNLFQTDGDVLGLVILVVPDTSYLRSVL